MGNIPKMRMLPIFHSRIYLIKKENCSIYQISEETKIIGDIVKITVDRPLESYHPLHQMLYYPINDGYVKGVMAADRVVLQNNTVSFLQREYHPPVPLKHTAF